MSKRTQFQESNSAVQDAPEPILDDKDRAAFELGYESSTYFSRREYPPYFTSEFGILRRRLAEIIPPNIYVELERREVQIAAAWDKPINDSAKDRAFPLPPEERNPYVQLAQYAIPSRDPRRIWYRIGRALGTLADSNDDLSCVVQSFQGSLFSDTDETAYEAAMTAFRTANPLPLLPPSFDWFSSEEFNSATFVKTLVDTVQELRANILKAVPTLNTIATINLRDSHADLQAQGNWMSLPLPKCDKDKNKSVVDKIYGSICSQTHDIIIAPASCYQTMRPSPPHPLRTTKSKKKGGRPSEEERDEQMLQAWETRQYKNREELRIAFNMNKLNTVDKALRRAPPKEGRNKPSAKIACQYESGSFLTHSWQVTTSIRS